MKNNQLWELSCEDRLNIVSNVLQELDNCTIGEYSNSDGDNDMFIIMETWSYVKEFNEQFFRKYPEYKCELKEEDSGEILDNLTHYNWGFSDEYTTCSNCGKIVCTNTYGKPEFVIFDCDLICNECLHENESYQQNYIDSLINNHKNANISLTEEELEKLGYEQIGEEYASGWYGRMDNPKEILDKLLEKEPNGKFVFNITNNNQFETQFEVWRFNK